MEEGKLHLLLGRASEEVSKHTYLWLFHLAVIVLPIVGSAWFVFGGFERLSFDFKNIPTVMWLLGSYTYFYLMGKYCLTLSRNPLLVKKYPWQAFKYSLTDGTMLRLCYSLLAASLRLGSFYLYTVFFNFVWQFNSVQIGALEAVLRVALLVVLLPFLYLAVVDARLFLLSYVIQDSYSEDNLLTPLSFLTCIKKSSQLISGYNFHYAWLSMAQYLLIYLHYHIVADAFHRNFAGQALAGNHSFFLFIANALFVGVLVMMFLAVRVKWADFLMEFDREIVDFGDDE